MQQIEKDYEIVKKAMQIFKDPHRLKKVKQLAAQKEKRADKINLGGKHGLQQF